MEKELINYRKKLKVQNTVYIIAVLIIAAFITMSCMGLFSPALDNPRWESFWNGFIVGVSIAVAGIMILGFIINTAALHNEEKLKKLYIKEHDERSRAIAERAGSLSYWFETIGLLLGVIIGGYFNVTVSFVCLGVIFYICIVRLALKLYYNSKI